MKLNDTHNEPTNDGGFTAAELNAWIDRGFTVLILTATQTRSYKRSAGGDTFKRGKDGNLYIRRGRSWDRLTFDGGNRFLVKVV
jgi:hypothetical protein